MKYTAPELRILAVEAVNVLLASGDSLTNEGETKVNGNGDIVFHAAAGGVDIFR